MRSLISWIYAAPRPSNVFEARWLGLALAVIIPVCFSGCLTRTQTSPPLPYIQPANVVQQVDPAPLQVASRMQEIEQEVQRLRDQLERLQASGADGTAIKNLQERVSFIERQLGMEVQAQAQQPAASVPFTSHPLPLPGRWDQPAAQDQRVTAVAPDNRQPPSVEIRSNPLPADEKAYREAYAAFRSGSLDQSVQMLEDFLKNYPRSEYASSAVYWLGEARFAQGRFDEAVLQFDRVLKEFPGSKKELNSLLKQGESFEKMGETRSARVIYEKIVSDYPHTAQGRLAGGKLKSLPRE